MTDAAGPSRSVLTVSVVDPDRPGPLSPDAMDAATAALRSIGDDVGAVLVAHPGRNFCVGGDVTAFAGAADPGDYVEALAQQFHHVVRALVSSPVPVVAAFQGWAAGAGMSLIAACDLVVAGRGARMRPAYPGIAFTPDGGMSWTLPRAVGRARALEILLTDRVIGAEEALDLGLVSRVVDDADVLDEATALAATIAAGPARALGRIRSLVDAGLTATLDDQLDAEAVAIGRSASSPEGRAAVAAFAGRAK